MQNPPPARVHNFRTLYCAHCGHDLAVPISCGDRFCPECSRLRASRVRRRLRYILHNYAPPPGHFLAMITLSIQNQEKLDLQVKGLVASFRKLRQRDSWKKHVQGGATIIEIKKGKIGWHAHLHILCYMRYYPWKELHRNWQEVSGGAAVWLTSCSSEKAISYVTKYVTKSDLPDESRPEASAALAKYRLFQRFGLWQGWKIPVLKSDYPCPTCKRVEWIFLSRAELDIKRYG